MPIPKSKCVEQRTKAIRAMLDNLYKTIDEELLKHGHYRQDTDKIFGATDTDIKFNHLKSDYEASGWKVTRQKGYDQRDGDGWDYITII